MYKTIFFKKNLITDSYLVEFRGIKIAFNRFRQKKLQYVGILEKIFGVVLMKFETILNYSL